MARCCRRLTADIAGEFLASVDTFLFDCDGVLWNHQDATPGAVETLDKLRNLNKKVFFVTNNSTKSRADYVKKCLQLGFHAEEDEIICTAFVAAQYLKSILPANSKVYVMGMPGMLQELDKAGIRHIGSGPDVIHGTITEWVQTELDPEVNCVLLGFDENISYLKVMKAASYARRKGAFFVATNEDNELPMDGPIVIPGTGVVVAAVKTAAARDPIVVGKPHHPMFDMIAKSFNVEPDRTVMVGDRLNTDIMWANNCGLHSIMVLTGIATLEEAQHLMTSNSIEHQKQIPEFYLDKIGDLEEFLN
ncbi:glycerol-3-phosphate phosphatase [Lingula anatina]|uniref:Glycerol-3-phosphate phosphatase n=1 Tax=Lingula anatina TaxID=7574 RepID=A0A1S3IU09_LINAN|nr:glycerol-3-phosphate phosphatase [Lingula anatina]|eukprot:XP_013401421.1 glycerol-3-phosphate phosphatase [Lingula anatina]